MRNQLRAGREKNSIIWRCITIPEVVARCLHRFLTTAQYSEPYANDADARHWERLKAAYYACPDHIRLQLPEMPWPDCVPDEVIERARDLAELYRTRTAEERAPLLRALSITAPLPDLDLFGITHQESRTGELRPSPPARGPEQQVIDGVPPPAPKKASSRPKKGRE